MSVSNWGWNHSGIVNHEIYTTSLPNIDYKKMYIVKSKQKYHCTHWYNMHKQIITSKYVTIIQW